MIYQILTATLLSVILFLVSCSQTQGNKTQLHKFTTPPLQPVDQEFGMFPKVKTDWKEIKAEKITDEVIFEKREMPRYDKEKTSDYKCASYQCIAGKMRSFIWNHWKNKRLGYLKYKMRGIDLSITEHIFIEPDKKGKWKVIWKSIKWHTMSDLSKSVEAVGEISMEKVKGNNWKLIFKSENGEILKEL